MTHALSERVIAGVEAAKGKITVSRKTPSPTRAQGKIVAFNLRPQGQIEGALVETTRSTTQLNLPNEDQERNANA